MPCGHFIYFTKKTSTPPPPPRYSYGRPLKISSSDLFLAIKAVRLYAGNDKCPVCYLALASQVLAILSLKVTFQSIWLFFFRTLLSPTRTILIRITRSNSVSDLTLWRLIVLTKRIIIYFGRENSPPKPGCRFPQTSRSWHLVGWPADQRIGAMDTV